jgi:BirA family biotin operon repressor/biotin-[acetyl-CoA-carboxylase] ligase
VNAGPAHVLEALRRADGACSGEGLSDELGVSRAQVWKHVEALRKRGYGIDGEPGGGYRLSATPDRLYAEEIDGGLETRWLARQIEYLDETDSTNRVATQRAAEGVAPGYTVIAEGQTAGRGRLGRSFFSPPYLNLYTSIVLRPQISTADAPTLIPAAAIAVAEAVAAELDDPTEAEIKWPNDIMLGGLKTCGILMEMSAEATRVGHVVLGIGVNLNVDREMFPDEFKALATSLSSHTGRPIDRVRFAQRLYSILERTLDEHARSGFEALLPRYEARFKMTGKRVRVIEALGEQAPDGGQEDAGRVIGIDNDGALRIERDGGEEVRVIAGDVTLAKENPVP